jgi:CRP/FNR family transcriptional regulator
MQLLASCNLFQGLSETQLQRLADITKEMQIEKGEWLFQEGQEANGLFILKEGAVELLTKVDDEFELPIAMLREPGMFLGTSALTAPYVYSLSARCTEQGSLLVIERTELEKLIQEDRELGYIIMTNWAEHLLNRLKETRQELKIHFKTLFKSMHS